jgi:AcrR family transcriptional regulator
MDAARDLFARDGVEAVSMRKIAEAIEYSPTAIYLHFADKDALLEELCANDFGSLAQAFNKEAAIQGPHRADQGAGPAVHAIWREVSQSFPLHVHDAQQGHRILENRCSRSAAIPSRIPMRGCCWRCARRWRRGGFGRN